VNRYPPIHNNKDKNKNLPIFVQPMVRVDVFNSMFLIDTREATDAFEGRVLDPFNNLLPQVATMNAVTNQKSGAKRSTERCHYHPRCAPGSVHGPDD
jgi:hypothetical protein